MNVHTDTGGEDPLGVSQFYYSPTLPYLMMKHQAEILWRLVETPRELGLQELAPDLIALGEAGDDPAWQIFRTYLDKIETEIASNKPEAT
jgi:hypothetical protein